MLGFTFAPSFLPSVPGARALSPHLPTEDGFRRSNLVRMRISMPELVRRIFQDPSAHERARNSSSVEGKKVSDLGAGGDLLENEAREMSTVQGAPPRRLARDPRRVLIVGGGREVSKEVAAYLKDGRERYYVVGVLSAPEDGSNVYDRTVVFDVATQAKQLADRARELRIGVVIWCESSTREQKPSSVDYAGVRDLVKHMGPDWLVDDDDVEELADFARAQHRAAFHEIDDAIMGGRSRSQLRPGGQRGPALWAGNLSTEDGGGFCSMRAALPLSGRSQGSGIDLSSCAGIAVTCRGDGKRYKINLRNEEAGEQVFQASFDTVCGSTEWQTIRVPFSEFLPVSRGRLLYADADPNGSLYQYTLDTTSITSVGLVCSKIEPGFTVCPLFTTGPFELELARIDAYRYVSPRFVLVSSAAVTRPYWNEEKMKLHRPAAQIPIVKLNPTIGNLLGAKLAGENALRASRIPYCILRPTQISDKAPSGRAVQIEQGDVVTGRISARDVARVVVSAIKVEGATWKTVELNGGRDERTNEEFLDELTVIFERLSPDSEQVLYSSSLSDVLAG